ncbi:MAG: hypothetical protein IJI27_07850 [Oscillospiraceae bacterium]|nr:hypothetical protein [Oscillospiraceae bacterium]
MAENEVAVAVVAPADEQALSREVTDIEFQAEALAVTTDEEYQQAAEFGKIIKQKAAAVMEFFKPMKDSAYQAHRAICDREKTMLTPLKNAEAIVKKTMGTYVTEQERKKREQEEALRRAAEAERERLLKEAAEKEMAGDAAGTEELLAEAVVMDEATTFAAPTRSAPKVSGVSTARDWEITEINERMVPMSVMGAVIRPVDKAAVMRLIRATKGTVQIPGIAYKEVAKMSFSRR